jgi:hypothetical protein
VFLKHELDAVEAELARIAAVGGHLVASTQSEAEALIARFRELWPGRPPVVVITGVSPAEKGDA